MTTRFFTNSDGNTLLQKFAAVFSNNPQIAEFDACFIDSIALFFL